MLLFLLCHTLMQGCCSILLLIYKHSKSAGALLLHAESHMGPLIRGKSELKWQAHKARAVSCFTMAAARSQELGHGGLACRAEKGCPRFTFPVARVFVCLPTTPHLYPSQTSQICLIRLSSNKMASWAESQHPCAL